jgi:hypothetical protein
VAGVTDRMTEVMMVPGLVCALCGDEGSPGLHVPVMTPDGQVRMPRICQPCVAVFSGVLLQLLGYAGSQVAAVAVSVHSTGLPAGSLDLSQDMP